MMSIAFAQEGHSEPGPQDRCARDAPPKSGGGVEQVVKKKRLCLNFRETRVGGHVAGHVGWA